MNTFICINYTKYLLTMAKEWMWLTAPAAAAGVGRRPPPHLLSFPLLLLPLLVLPPRKKETLLGAQRRVMFRGILVNITGISVGAPGILGRLQEGLEGVVAETQLAPGGQSAGLARRGTCGAAQVARALENNAERESVRVRVWLARATGKQIGTYVHYIKRRRGRGTL